MPRDIPLAIRTGMTGSFTPCFLVELLDSDRVTVLWSTEEVLSFVLDGLSAKVSFHDPTRVTTYSTFRISRGILVAGVKTYVASSQYYCLNDRHEKRIRTLEGHVFPIAFYSSPGDVTYREIIDAVCATYGLNVRTDIPAEAWQDYQFYPDGRTFTLNTARQFFTILRQKYLIFATDDGMDQLYFFQARATPPAYPSGYTSLSPGLVSFPGVGSYKKKSFLSRDEAGTTHTSGDPGDPIHNLGYLESTAAHPDRTFFYDTNDWIVVDVPPHLAYLDFDAFKVTFDIGILALWPSKVREIFDQKLHPSWQFQIRFLDIFGNTEGGAIPGTIEAAAPYTPVNVTNFDKNLSSAQNNLQALADKVDELDTAPAIAAGTSMTSPADEDVIPIIDMSLATPATKKLTWLDMLSKLSMDTYISGLQMVWVSATAITIKRGYAFISDEGKIVELVNDKALTGLSLAANTWFHVYLYLNAGSADIEISSTAPSAPYSALARNKTSDGTRRYIGSIRTAAANTIRNFQHHLHNGYVAWLCATFTGVTNGQAVVYTDIDFSASAPVTSRLIYLNGINTDAAQACAIHTDDTPDDMFIMYAGVRLGLLMPINSTQKMQYKYLVAPTSGYYNNSPGYFYDR